MAKRRLRILELILERVNIPSSVTGRAKTGTPLMIVSLVWPRPGIAGRVALKPVDVGEEAVDYKKDAWVRRVLFKEKVLGPFGIEIGVTRRVPEGTMHELMRYVGTGVLGIAADEVPDMVTSSLGAGVVGLPFAFLEAWAKGKGKKDPTVVGSGSVDLCADTQWQMGVRRRLKVKLTVAKDLFRVVQTRKHGNVKRVRKRVVSAGDPCGEVVLSARMLD